MIVQLLAVGDVLVLLFEVENPWLALAVVGFMLGVSSWIARAIFLTRRGRVEIGPRGS